MAALSWHWFFHPRACAASLTTACDSSSSPSPRTRRPAAELASQIPLYRERHLLKAGLTCWAQINYPYWASIDDSSPKLRDDFYEVKNFSILFDLVILLLTLRAVPWPSGAR